MWHDVEPHLFTSVESGDMMLCHILVIYLPNITLASANFNFIYSSYLQL